MKFFIKRIFLFSFFILIVILLFQFIISLRIKGKTVRGHDNLELTSNKNADLVFLGSSRCWVHFDPNFFDTTYKLKSINIGVDGHSEISMAITRLQVYLLTNSKPKFVIFSFDPLMRSGSLTKNLNFVHKNDFARYAFWPEPNNLLMVNYFNYDLYERYIPLYSIFKYKLLLNCILLNNRDNYYKNGYEINDYKWDTINNPVSDKMKQNFFKLSDISAITTSLDSLKKLCLKNSIKLMCIQTPVYKIIEDDFKFLETQIICERLNIPFIDVNKKNIRDDINYFYNSDHLNKLGVNQMNLFLKQDSLLSSFLKSN